MTCNGFLLMTATTILMWPFILQRTNALKILVVQPHYMYFGSHFGFSLNLAKFLSAEGHRIHMLVPISDESYKLAPNSAEHKLLNVRYFMQKKTLPLTSRIVNGDDDLIDQVYIEIADDLKLMEELRAEKFDVGMAEAFYMTEYSLALFHLLQISVTIATHSQPIAPFHLFLLGVLGKMNQKQEEAMPLDFIGLPTMNLSSNFEHHFKLLNMRSTEETEAHLRWRRPQIWAHCVSQTLARIREHIIWDAEYQKLAEQKYQMNFPGWGALFANTRFFLVNSLPQLDIVQSKIVKGVEKIKFVGGFNLVTPSEMDAIGMEKANALVDSHLGSREGIILVSFGTYVDITQPQNAHLMEALVGTMEHFPNFLFIFKLAKVVKKGMFKWNNVLVQSWINQKELLAHPNTKAFVSHCGMNSVLESVFHAVPIVCMPFFGDQYYNAELLTFQQIGLVVDRYNTKETLQMELISALTKALGDSGEKSAGGGLHFDLNALKAMSAAFRQGNSSAKATISKAMKEIEKEIQQQKQQ